MSLGKQYKLAEKAAIQQRQVVGELEALVKSIDRCEKTVTELKDELEAVQNKYQTRNTTQEEIAYLTDLLKCAHKKLSWEKQIASLQRKTPALLDEVTRVINDPKNPPADEIRLSMVRALQLVQGAMQRLEQVKTD
jgi:DNA-binding transcriptional regulator GbsR (MarR family)